MQPIWLNFAIRRQSLFLSIFQIKKRQNLRLRVDPVSLEEWMDSSVGKLHENFEKFEMISTRRKVLYYVPSWPKAWSNPTARRGQNYLEFFKIFMNIGTELSTLSMGRSIF